MQSDGFSVCCCERFTGHFLLYNFCCFKFSEPRRSCNFFSALAFKTMYLSNLITETTYEKQILHMRKKMIQLRYRDVCKSKFLVRLLVGITFGKISIPFCHN